MSSPTDCVAVTISPRLNSACTSEAGLCRLRLLGLGELLLDFSRYLGLLLLELPDHDLELPVRIDQFGFNRAPGLWFGFVFFEPFLDRTPLVGESFLLSRVRERSGGDGSGEVEVG